MAQSVVTKIQRLDALRGQAAQGMTHALEIRFHGHFPVVTFRDDIGQPNHRRPPPAEPPLRPMAWDMPVQDLRQAHLDHLPDEEGHIVDTLGDDHQVTCPKDLLGLLRQLHSHGTLLPKLHMLWREHSNGTPWAQRAVDSKLQAPQKSAFGLFVRRMGRYRYREKNKD